jgi:hypothetical protein
VALISLVYRPDNCSISSSSQPPRQLRLHPQSPNPTPLTLRPNLHLPQPKPQTSNARSQSEQFFSEREFLIDNLLVRNHLIIEIVWWTGLAPWEFAFPFPGSRISTFLKGAYDFDFYLSPLFTRVVHSSKRRQPLTVLGATISTSHQDTGVPRLQDDAPP